MNLLAVRCPKCHVTVGVMPGTTTWHCGVQMAAVDPSTMPVEAPRTHQDKRLGRKTPNATPEATP